MKRAISGCHPRSLGAFMPRTPVIIAVVAMLVASPVALPPPALAQWAVFDAANFSQNVLTAARELQQINNQIQSLTNEAQMLVNQAKNLESLPTSTLFQLEASVQRT